MYDILDLSNSLVMNNLLINCPWIGVILHLLPPDESVE